MPDEQINQDLEHPIRTPSPGDEWRCFHCGEVFTTVGSARLHFGAKPSAKPGCLLKVEGYDKRNLHLFREMENKYNELREFLLEACGKILEITPYMVSPFYQDKLAGIVDQILSFDIQVLRGNYPAESIPHWYETKSKRELFQIIERMLLGQGVTTQREIYFTALTGLHHVWKDKMLQRDRELLVMQREKIEGLKTQITQMSKGYRRKIAKLEKDITRLMEKADARSS